MHFVFQIDLLWNDEDGGSISHMITYVAIIWNSEPLSIFNETNYDFVIQQLLIFSFYLSL